MANTALKLYDKIWIGTSLLSCNTANRAVAVLGEVHTQHLKVVRVEVEGLVHVLQKASRRTDDDGRRVDALRLLPDVLRGDRNKLKLDLARQISGWDVVGSDV